MWKERAWRCPHCFSPSHPLPGSVVSSSRLTSARAEACGVCLHVSATVTDRTCSPGSRAQPPAPSLLSFLSELLSLGRLLGALCLGEVTALPWCRMAQLTRLRIGQWRDSQASAPTGFPGGTVIKNLPANPENAGSIPGWGRSHGGGNGNLFQYSCLENPMDRGAWWLQSMGSQRARHY